MKDILKRMIFFRKNKPAHPAKNAEPAPKKAHSFQDIAHDRVQTAEGWRRSMEKKVARKAK